MWKKKQSQKRFFSIFASFLMIFLLITPGISTAGSVQKPRESQADSKTVARDKVSDTLMEAFKEDDQVTFLIKFKEKADLLNAKQDAKENAKKASLSSYQTKHLRNSAVLSALKETAFEEQRSVQKYLDMAVEEGLAKDVHSFYVVNGMAVTATKDVAEQVAAFDEVEFVAKSETRQLNESTVDETISTDTGIEWNVDRIEAPAAWELGIDGTGTVVASIDTGVQWNHPALKEKYYGYNAKTGEVDHSNSWFDAIAGEKQPDDDHGHGTHTIGTMVGGESDGSNQVGVAPGAKFVSAKAFSAEGGTDVDITSAGEWVANHADIIDVVTNSWGGSFPGIDEWYMDIVDSWIELDIFPEFSAGNSNWFYNPGGPGSIVAPANYPQSFATGNTDKNDMIAESSLRGPSPYGEVKPDISAPGTAIRSSAPDGSYETMSGTSMAAPAVSAVAAMLRQVDANISVDEMKDLLKLTATPRTDNEYSTVPNNGYGHGIVNAYRAVTALQDGLGIVEGTVEGVAGLPIDGQVTIKETGKSTPIDSANGSFSILHPAGSYTALAEAYGYASSEQPVEITKDGTTEVTFELETLSTYEVSGRVVSKENGEPIVGAKLHLLEDSKVKIDNTDTDGNFTFEAYDGDYTLKVLAKGHKVSKVNISIEESDIQVDVELEPLYISHGDEIGYDNDNASSPIVFREGGKGAVRMSLPIGRDSAVVTGGSFKFWDADTPNPGETEFAVEVWDANESGKPNKKIAGPIYAEVIRDKNEWIQVDLTDESIIVNGDFFMVYVQVGEAPNVPALAADSTFSFRSWEFGNGRWDSAEFDHYLIRAQVGYEVETPIITSPDKPYITSDSKIEITGEASKTTTLQLTNNEASIWEDKVGVDGKFSIDTNLNEGENIYKAKTIFEGKVIRESDPITVLLDTIAPELAIGYPKTGDKLKQQSVTVKGTIEDENLDTVAINGEITDVDGKNYSKQILLKEGFNVIEVVAVDKAGNSTTKTTSVEVISEAPVLQNVEPKDVQYIRPGDKVEVSFSSNTTGGIANFEVNLPSLNNAKTLTSANMEEVQPGLYKGIWNVPTNVNMNGATIEVSLTDKAGNTTIEEAEGKLFIYSEKIDRSSGASRYDTAIETSKTGWNKADTVILSRGDQFADALAGVPLAHKLDAPILLTPSTKLWEETKNEIARLGAKNVVILGGIAAISSEVEQSLTNEGFNVRRINGGDRFSTAELIAKEVAPDGTSEIAVVNGMDFPDALSIASSAAQKGIPILLAKDDWMSDSTLSIIKELGAKKTYVVGGTTVISETIADKLPGASRLSGKDRYGTNVDVLEHFGVTSKHMYIATGTNYADALTGAVLAAKNNSAVLLVHKKVPELTGDYITAQDLKHLTIFGGTAAVDNTVEQSLVDLIK